MYKDLCEEDVILRGNIDKIAGCLLGGALGDALGAPVESYTYNQIIKEYGPDGICELQCGIHGKAEITDDTQMTLFTAEGLLRAECRAYRKEIKRNLSDTTMVVFRAYLRWLYTQGLSTSHWNGRDYDGWLVGVKQLYVNKEAGTTCITTLGKGMMGRIDRPINNSKTCGAIMRIAPVGLFESEEDVFELGCRIGAITHGHPSAYFSAGAMSLLIHNIIKGKDIVDAVSDVLEVLKGHEKTEECIEKIEMALELYKTESPSQESVKKIGYGWDATETLAIGIYCALCYPDDITKALVLAVNHDGDSDSTGSVTGNILGAYLGKSRIPETWLQKLQLTKEIETMAKDLCERHCTEEEWKFKYPGW